MNTTENQGSARLRAADLAHLLDLAAPHMPATGDVAALAGIHVAITPGVLELTATNRFTVLRTRIDADTEGAWSGMAPAGLVKTLRRHLPARGKRAETLVTLSGDGNLFTADTAPVDPTATALSLRAEATGLRMPPLSALLRKVEQLAPAACDIAAVSPASLARFANLGGPVRMGFSADGKLMFLLTDTAIGLIALARFSEPGTGTTSEQVWAARLAEQAPAPAAVAA